jgi:hypothetical protein
MLRRAKERGELLVELALDDSGVRTWFFELLRSRLGLKSTCTSAEAATSSAVDPSAASIVGLAEYFINVFTSFILPDCAARWIGVSP